MRILARYIFREFLTPLFYCLTGFVSIYVLFELFGSFSRLSEAKLPFGEAVAYFAGYLSPFFHYLAPAALMLATLYTMWNFCRHSELTAMRASGVSLVSVAKPLLLGAAAMALAVAWVNEVYMPRRAQWAKSLRAERFNAAKVSSAGGLSYCDSRQRRTWAVNGGHDALCRRLGDVRITTDRPDGSRETSITAKKAMYLDGEWWLFSPTVRHYDTGGRPVATPTPELDALPLRVFPHFRERPEDIMMQNCDPRFTSVRGKFRYLRTNKDMNDASRDALRYDAWAQAFSPLACLVMTLLAIPGGIASGRQSVFAGILGTLVLFFAYYGMTIGCLALAKTGLMPPVPAAALPPVAFTALGLFRCRRTMTQTMALLAVYAALVGAYAASAALLSGRLGVDRAMAHSLAATLPVLAAAACTARLGRRASRAPVQ